MKSETSSQLSPRARRIFLTLQERIQTGQYHGGDWLPSERSLATEFDVSRILIRAAVEELARSGLITRSTHHRPLIVAHKPSSKTVPTVQRNIGLWIWPQQSWPGTAMIIRGIQENMGEGFRLVLGSAIGEYWEEIRNAEERFLRQALQDRNIEGLLLTTLGGASNLPLLEKLRTRNTPMTFIDHLPPDGFQADFVGVNNKRAAERGIAHLISLGHRRIAHVSNFDSFSTVSERLEGYRNALASASIPFRPEFVERDPGPPADDPDAGCEALVERLLRLPKPPTAIFAVHDVAAYRVIAALRARGVRVPEDMSILGFDGMERWTPASPFLTTLNQPFSELGSYAVKTLLERVEKGADAPYRHTLLEAPLHIHHSTRPPKI